MVGRKFESLKSVYLCAVFSTQSLYFVQQIRKSVCYWLSSNDSCFLLGRCCLLRVHSFYNTPPLPCNSFWPLSLRIRFVSSAISRTLLRPSRKIDICRWPCKPAKMKVAQELVLNLWTMRLFRLFLTLVLHSVNQSITFLSRLFDIAQFFWNAETPQRRYRIQV